MTLIDPAVITENDIPCDTVTQEKGQIIITFPFGFHAGFNNGVNFAEATNFALKRWIEYGKRSRGCNCPGMLKIKMDEFIKIYQPEQFEMWKAGTDKTPHPEQVAESYDNITREENPEEVENEESIAFGDFYQNDGSSYFKYRHPSGEIFNINAFKRSKGKFKCTTCAKESSDRRAYIRHFLRKHLKRLDLKDFVCKTCQEAFFTPQNLQEHYEISVDCRPHL